MITVAHKKRLVNPAKKRRRSNLSPRQIKFFGTAAQKAALKRKRQAAAGKAHRRRNKAAARKNTPRRKNVGEVVVAGLMGANPAERRSTKVAQKKRKNRKNSVAPRRRYNASKHSPSTPRRRRPSHKNPAGAHRRRRHNPGGGVMTLLEKGAFVIGGAVGSRALPQMLLGGNNTGWLGYLANGITALVLGWGTGKFWKRDAGQMVTIGGFGALVLRVIADNTTIGQQLQSQLQGVGDVGVYGATTFFVPLAERPGGDRGAVDLPAAVIPPPTPPPAAGGNPGKGMGRYSGAGRFSAAGRYM